MELQCQGMHMDHFAISRKIVTTKCHSTAPLKGKKDHVSGGLEPIWIEEKRSIYRRRHSNYFVETKKSIDSSNTQKSTKM